jgi:NhaP-type Na+/H+ or K+/H+ antiporter
MVALLVFALVLLVGALLSELAERSVLSVSVIFLVAGFVAGDAVLGLVPVRPDQPVVAELARMALFAVLFSEGMLLDRRTLTACWKLPGRALLLGLPLTLVVTALAARWMAGLPWRESLLVGAILAPTDPVFAAAIVKREGVPPRLQTLLNIESGINDGLALPIVVALLAGFAGPTTPAGVLVPVLAGIAVGIAIPRLVWLLERAPWLSTHGEFQPLKALATGLLIFAATRLLGVNEFLAAFAGGVTVATASPELADEFRALGGQIAELLKFAGLLVFGALLSWGTLGGLGIGGFAAAAVALFVARPLGLWPALLGSGLGPRERIAAFWFGPKGFASVIYAIMALQARTPNAQKVFALCAFVITASIVLHSSSDVPLARWLRPDLEDGASSSAACDEAAELAAADARATHSPAPEHAPASAREAVARGRVADAGSGAGREPLRRTGTG